MKLQLNLNNIRLRNKMLIVYALCVFIPILFTNLVFYFVTTNNVKEQRIEDISRALEQVKNDFKAEIDNTLAISYMFYTDSNLNDILEKEYASSLEYVNDYDNYFRRILNSFTPVFGSVQNIKIYLDNPTLLHSGGVGLLTDHTRESEWYQALGNQSHVLVRTYKEDSATLTSGERLRDTFSFVSKMNYFSLENRWEKILKIELRTQTIQRIFSNLNLNGYAYLLNDRGEIQYTNDPEVEWRRDTVLFDDIPLPMDAVMFNTEYTNVSYLNNWKLIGVISEDEVFLEVRQSREFIFWLAAINLLLSTVIITWITRSLNVRLVNILKHMKKVKNQNFDTIKGMDYQDEIGQLTGEFNRMTMQIKSLIDDVYIADIHRKGLELERRRAQLNALQSQINPHFLFNALETIRMRSLIKNEIETAKIIQNMAKLFRSSLTWSKDKVTIEEEVEFMLCFLEIQQYRFGDRLQFHIHVDPAIKDCLIPKMVFLPFVENASIHGIEPLKKGGSITLDIVEEDDHIVFTIEDNGAGMSEEQVERLYSYLDNEEELGEHIGVQNVIYRLKMIYGPHFKLYIRSAPGDGTFIKIVLPKMTEDQFGGTSSAVL